MYMCIIEVHFYINEVKTTEISACEQFLYFSNYETDLPFRSCHCYQCFKNTEASNYDFKAEKKAVIAELDQRFDGYREHCYPLPGDGCKCQETVNGVKGTYKYEKDAECKTGEKRIRLCEDKECKTDFKKINRCRTKDKCGQDKWKPYEDCMKACTKIHPILISPAA
ncbi:hypothetical protein T4E_3193 [Trichinella pseudospiralis]|uniref:Uncharacterized protein n=1 Tax=Trichinella pseudospiralis TaxID=6337 RepID=A0A0V0XZ60_TRIPS|nr:hypothetical protein T4E_3193 [Trichinella pseudospiralis]